MACAHNLHPSGAAWKHPPFGHHMRHVMLLSLCACLSANMNGPTQERTPSFRPGSGTLGSADDKQINLNSVTVRTTGNLQNLATLNLHDSATLQPTRRLANIRGTDIKTLTYILCFVGIMAAAVMMYEGRGHGRYDPKQHSGSRKPPPPWSPEWRDYPLRQWVKEVGSWIVLTDFLPHQLGTVIKDQLQGTAGILAREYSQTELLYGRTLPNGTTQDPVTMIFSDLQTRFGPRVEEDQQRVDHEMETFERKPGEPFETMLLRHELLRARQRDEGMQQFSFRTHALTLQWFAGPPLPRHPPQEEQPHPGDTART